MQCTKGKYYIGTVAFEKLLINDERQCERLTIDDDECSLVAISHLWDSEVVNKR